MTMPLPRRRFLQASAAGSLGYFFLAPTVSAARIHNANEKIRFAGIGVGGKGRSDIEQAGALGEVVALCDVDESEKHLGWAANKWKDAKTFTDFRKLFDNASLLKNIDAFTISTPDHTHALPAALAIRAGKHVYVQKPLTRTVFEAHLLRKLATQNKVCTQMGNQGTAAHGLRRAVELIQAGELGSIKEVHVWTNRPIWPQAPGVTDKKPPQAAETPKTVNWDAFIGPATDRGYAKGIHPFAWRGFWDFGTGAIGDMACHTANMAFMALKLGHPIHASAEAGDVNPLTCPSFAKVVLKFPARGDLAPVTLRWYEGKIDGKKVLPPEELIAKALKISGKQKLVDSGSILVGEKGIAYSPDDYGSEVHFETGAKTNNGTKPEKLPANGGSDSGQKKEWVEAIKTGDPKKALSNFDYASYLTAAFLLGNVAIRTGKAFEFNGETLEAKGCPEAAQYIKAEYRKGWDMLEGRA
jgi:predicted dehydrogenase